jgi:UTP-glucose-1-phosphate uridylyltransferase
VQTSDQTLSNNIVKHSRKNLVKHCQNKEPTIVKFKCEHKRKRHKQTKQTIQNTELKTCAQRETDGQPSYVCIGKHMVGNHVLYENVRNAMVNTDVNIHVNNYTSKTPIKI